MPRRVMGAIALSLANAHSRSRRMEGVRDDHFAGRVVASFVHWNVFSTSVAA